jgi:hypothetical protein
MRSTRRAVAVAGLLALTLSGCVEVDGELTANGTFTFRYTYHAPIHATFKSERARLSSAHVRIENLERDQSLPGYEPNEWVTATLVVDDVRQLPSATAFAEVKVDADLAAGRLELIFPGLDAKVRNWFTEPGDDTTIDRRGLRLHLLLPGPVTHAEPAATVDGRSVTWTLSLRQLTAFGATVRVAVAWTPPATS